MTVVEFRYGYWNAYEIFYFICPQALSEPILVLFYYFYFCIHSKMILHLQYVHNCFICDLFISFSQLIKLFAQIFFLSFYFMEEFFFIFPIFQSIFVLFFDQLWKMVCLLMLFKFQTYFRLSFSIIYFLSQSYYPFHSKIYLPLLGFKMNGLLCDFCSFFFLQLLAHALQSLLFLQKYFSLTFFSYYHFLHTLLV